MKEAILTPRMSHLTQAQKMKTWKEHRKTTSYATPGQSSLTFGHPYLAIQSHPDIQLGFFPCVGPFALSSTEVGGFSCPASGRLFRAAFEPTRAPPSRFPSPPAATPPRRSRSGNAVRAADSAVVASDVGNLARNSIGSRQSHEHDVARSISGTAAPACQGR